MFNKISKFTFKAAVFTFALTLLGCASTPRSADDLNVKTEFVSSKHLKLSKVLLTNKSAGFSIEGEISSHGNHRINALPKGHLDIDIVDRNNRVLHKTTTPFHRISKANKPHKRYHFRMDVPHILKGGSIVRVSLHEVKQH